MNTSQSLLHPNPASSPSTSASASKRPVSAAVYVSPPPPPSSSRKQRASHSVATSKDETEQQQQQQQQQQRGFHDVYAHPAAVAFLTAHPRRTIPKFGPYLLLQTLGEGEFGKVKLGIHHQWGEEVAVKLIRRGSIDNTVRMSKVEREIEVLRSLKHPNIVRLYDVIETDKYIGIILEYASGGELFDHILAHRYLREKDACKLFAQLISGVWYIHQKKIVHRDLKLENLLLDRNRNVIITDFGFANRFEHKSDDLMQTSCGSPCYAAPELVISEGMYVGSAVDVWSCGVILYAMLAGYLPFDDDPANPDGDNINLLYKYIVNTPLTFPDYVSDEARDLLSLMLVPDPLRRSGLRDVMQHRWLEPYRHLFDHTVPELERLALEQQNMKRDAYRRQIRAHADQQRVAQQQSLPITRSQSAAGSSPTTPRSRQPPQLVYDSSNNQDVTTPSGSSRRAVASAIVMSRNTGSEMEPTLSPSAVEGETDRERKSKRSRSKDSSRSKRSHRDKGSKVADQGSVRKKRQGAYRHTVQVEYDNTEGDEALAEQVLDISSQDVDMVHVGEAVPPDPAQVSPMTATSSPKVNGIPITPPPVSPARLDGEATKGTTVTKSSSAGLPGHSLTPARGVGLDSPVLPADASPAAVNPEAQPPKGETGSMGSSSSKTRHRKGLSMDKFGLSNILGGGSVRQSANTGPPSAYAAVGLKQEASDATSVAKEKEDDSEKDKEKAPEKVEVIANGKAPSSGRDSVKATRRAISVMVEPMRRAASRQAKNRSVTVESTDKGKEKEKEPSVVLDTSGEKQAAPAATPEKIPPFKDGVMSQLSAKGVMSWFRSKSLAKRDPDSVSQRNTTESAREGDQTGPYVFVTSPNKQPEAEPAAPSPTATSPPSSFNRQTSESGVLRAMRAFAAPRQSLTSRPVAGKPEVLALRVHHGPLDQAMVTSGAPGDVLRRVTELLNDMGVEMQKESEWKLRCVRPKKKRDGKQASESGEPGSPYQTLSLSGSAASNGIDKRGLPAPSTPFGGAFRGLQLLRRGSTQVSTPQVSTPSITQNATPSETDHGESLLLDTTMAIVPAAEGGSDTIYGDRSVDAGDEVRFFVELTRISGLEDTLSLDIRRLKGNLRSYKFLYDTLRERCDFSR